MASSSDPTWDYDSADHRLHAIDGQEEEEEEEEAEEEAEEAEEAETDAAPAKTAPATAKAWAAAATEVVSMAPGQATADVWVAAATEAMAMAGAQSAATASDAAAPTDVDGMPSPSACSSATETFSSAPPLSRPASQEPASPRSAGAVVRVRLVLNGERRMVLVPRAARFDDVRTAAHRAAARCRRRHVPCAQSQSTSSCPPMW
jgi:hypothetical protein